MILKTEFPLKPESLPVIVSISKILFTEFKPASKSQFPAVPVFEFPARSELTARSVLESEFMIKPVIMFQFMGMSVSESELAIPISES